MIQAMSLLAAVLVSAATLGNSVHMRTVEVAPTGSMSVPTVVHDGQDAVDLRKKAATAIDATPMNGVSAVMAMKADLMRQVIDPIIKKTVHTPSRLVFVAGLEGSGHHLWEPLTAKCAKAHVCVDPTSTEVEALAKSLWDGVWGDERGLFQVDVADNRKPKWSMKEPGENYTVTMDADSASTLDLLRALPAGISMLNVGGGQNDAVGMLSYPNQGGDIKAFKHPDIRILAELSEQAQVDLRIIVHIRNAKDTLISTAVKRGAGTAASGAELSDERQGFPSWETEAMVLSHNARILARQIDGLDPEFVTCLNYDYLPNVEIDDFLQGPTRHNFTFKNAMRNVFKSSDVPRVELNIAEQQSEAMLAVALDELRIAARC